MRLTLSRTVCVLLLAGAAAALLPAEAHAYINAGFKSEREYQQHLERERAAEVARATEAIRRAPGDPATYYYRGTVYSRRRNYEPAVADYDRAIQLDPKFARAYFRRGQALLALGWTVRDLPDRTESARLTARAMADLEKATQLDPKLVEAQVFFAAHTDDLAKAIRAATLACQHTDHDKEICMELLASLYARRGDFDSAVRWQEKAVRLTEFGRQAAEQRLEDYRQRRPNRQPVAWYFVK